jgi:uncharacterized protein (DUF488 family)
MGRAIMPQRGPCSNCKVTAIQVAEYGALLSSREKLVIVPRAGFLLGCYMINPTNAPFFTIGHSTRPLAEFVDLLGGAQVRLVADVRTIPRSRTNPQYNSETLPHTLRQFEIEYEHIASLGGLRGATRTISPNVNAFWQNKSFHNYADYALGFTFHEGLVKLIDLGRARRCAIMCAEAAWWRCHRRIIADYLLAAGETVFHIMGPGKMTLAEMTAGARSCPEGLTYPPAS